MDAYWIRVRESKLAHLAQTGDPWFNTYVAACGYNPHQGPRNQARHLTDTINAHSGLINALSDYPICQRCARLARASGIPVPIEEKEYEIRYRVAQMRR